MGKIKFTPEKKIEIIEAYKSGKVAYSQLQDVYGMNRNEIYRWILKYEANGIDAFVSGNRRYSKEFKIHCIEEYLSGIGSMDDIVAKYNISNREVLRKWIQRYNANKELKDYDPKREVYMANARRKTTLEERKEIVAYCITHNTQIEKGHLKNESNSACPVAAWSVLWWSHQYPNHNGVGSIVVLFLCHKR